MKKIPWRILFLLVLAVYLYAIWQEVSDIQFVCKWLLMPLLILDVKSRAKDLQPLLYGALLFSWAGDVLLLFQEKQSLFFIFGLAAFLLAHVCYVVIFHRIRTAQKLPNRPVFVILIALYYAVLIFFLSPYLGSLKIPVYIYGMVISFMLMMALHLFFLADREAGLLITVGALLFVLSDSVLAVNKFYAPFEEAGFIIMQTYGVAQYCIVSGVIRYTRKKKQS